MSARRDRRGVDTVTISAQGLLVAHVPSYVDVGRPWWTYKIQSTTRGCSQWAYNLNGRNSISAIPIRIFGRAGAKIIRDRPGSGGRKAGPVDPRLPRIALEE